MALKIDISHRREAGKLKVKIIAGSLPNEVRKRSFPGLQTATFLLCVICTERLLVFLNPIMGAPPP